jgi:peptidoglycan/xylan/chitin deacetylase (PgdA/CDA1 family)
LGKRYVFILLYHKVRPQASPLFGTAVTPENFERQMRFLKRYYNIVDLNAFRYSKVFSKGSKDVVVITFDDGYRDNYQYAFKILSRLKIPATIFLTTDFIGTNRFLWYDKLAWIMYNAKVFPGKKDLMKFQLPEEIAQRFQIFFNLKSEEQVRILRSMAGGLKLLSSKKRDDALSFLALACKVGKWPDKKDRPMLSWDEVKEMSERGISFGSHTKTHSRLSDLSENLVRKEVSQSKKIIEKYIGKKVTAFAYPYGKEADYSESIYSILRDEGFLYALTTTVGYETLPIKNPFNLKRRGAPLHPFLFC